MTSITFKEFRIKLPTGFIVINIVDDKDIISKYTEKFSTLYDKEAAYLYHQELSHRPYGLTPFTQLSLLRERMAINELRTELKLKLI